MEVLHYCKKIIIDKYASEEQLDKAEYLLLKYLKEHKDGNAYNLLGKLYLKKNNFNKSKEYFNKSLKYKELPSNYFGLFKISVFEDDLKKADFYLKMYAQTNPYPINLESYYLLLQILSDLKKGKFSNNYNKINTDKINVVDIEKLPISTLYNKCIDNILNKKYEIALGNMLLCQSMIIKRNIKLDLNTHIYLLYKIFQTYKIHLEQLKNEKINQLLHTIELLIEHNKLKEAEQLLNRINILNHRHKAIIEFLIQKINDKRHSNTLSKEAQRKIQYYIDLGHIYTDFEALQTYLEGLQTTKEDIFNYYIGKTFYQLKKYDMAFQYLMKYQGTEKRSKKYHYLLKIEKRVKKIKLSKQTISNIQELYKFQNFENIPSISRKREIINKYDKKYTKEIHMTVQDFMNYDNAK